VIWTTLDGMSTVEQGTWRAGRFWWDSSRPGEAGERRLQALIFDLDALTDVECGGHRLAFNAAFTANGLNVQWSVPRYRKLLALRDERQRVAAELRARGICTECDVLAKLLIDEICAVKEMIVDGVMLDADLAPRAGLVDLVNDAFTAGVAVGIIGSGRRRWVHPLVRQLIGDGLVQTLVTADDVGKPMPSRDAYHLALAEMGVHARDALAFTGSAVGLRMASAVGLAGLVVDPAAVIGARADYEGLRIADCQRLQSRLWTAGRRSAAA
jgi:beta-phosphoglucomutase-like phosphatase (HAD superfamily)